jgi:hypothetical protein
MELNPEIKDLVAIVIVSICLLKGVFIATPTRKNVIVCRIMKTKLMYS